MAAKNLTPFLLDAATVTARDAQYTGTPLTDVVGAGTYADPYLGGNRAGSNAPGVGINTGNVNPKLEDWTVLDQKGVARIPQNSQHIGGSGLGAGDQTNEPVRFIQGTDVNDTANFVVTDTAAVADAVMDTVSGAVNKTGATVAVGDRVWGPVPVA